MVQFLRTSALGFIWCILTLSVYGQWNELRPKQQLWTKGLVVQDSNIYVAVDGFGVFVSNDHGQGWAMMNTGIESLRINAIAGYNGYVFIGTEGNYIYRLKDNGNEWTDVSPEDIFSDIRSMSGNDSYLFALSWTRLYRTNNNGQTWDKLYPSLGVTVDKIYGHGDLLFVYSMGLGVYVSYDHGENWEWVVEGMTNGCINTVIVIDTFAFQGTCGIEVYRSSINSFNWANFNSGLNNAQVISFLATSSGLMAGSTKGLYQTSDYGLSWTLLNPSMRAESLSYSDSILFAVSYGVHKSFDHGMNWHEANSGISKYFPKSVAVLDTIVYFGYSPGPTARSINNGVTWEFDFIGDSSRDVRALRIAGNSIFAATWGEGVFQSSVYKSEWTPINAGLENLYVHSLFVFDSTILAGTQAGIFRSEDRGLGWESSNTGLPEHIYVNTFTMAGNEIYAGTEQGIFHSKDYGLTWATLNEGLLGTNVYLLESSGSDVFAGTRNGGIFILRDPGVFWESFNNGLDNLNIRSLAIIDTHILTGTLGGGVFISSSAKDNWESFNNGLDHNMVFSLAASELYMFAGTDRNVWRRSINDVLSSIDEVNNEISSRIQMYQVYPNPFEQRTTIDFDIFSRAFVTLDILDTHGRLVSRVIFEELERGIHSVEWHADELPGGVYFCRLQAGNAIVTKKILLIR